MKEHCPALQKQALPDRDRIEDEYLRDIIDNQRTVLESGPTELNLHYDETCNLKCPTCRPEVIGLKGVELERVARVRDKLFDMGVIRSAETLTLCGYGEVFASKIHLDFLKTVSRAVAPRLTIQILTNGLLLTEEMWNSVSNAHPLINEIWVSIDAATPETYAKNRGGDFSKLLTNLEFVKSLRRTGKISKFTISMVVQENNFEEMGAFADLGASLSCDRVAFQKLGDSDKADMADYAQRAIHRKQHPRHDELVAVVQSPKLDRRIVDFYTISDVLPVKRRPSGKIAQRVNLIPSRLAKERERDAQRLQDGHANGAAPTAPVMSQHVPAPNGHGMLSKPTETAVTDSLVPSVARTQDFREELDTLRKENGRLKILLAEAMLQLAERGFRF